VASLTTLRLAELATEAGAPPGAVNVVTGPVVGEALVRHQGVATIGFTGDTVTGKRIMAVASESVKPLGLELGGNNAFIVMADADVDAAAEGASFGAFFNAGQMCAAASRFYVHESVYEQFIEKLVASAGALRMGDPMDMDTVIGLVAYEGHRDKIESYIESAKRAGARLVLGGERPDTPETRDRLFVAPTIIADCANDTDIMQAEVFGPVIGVCPFSTREQTIAYTNDTPYGLSASIWTGDVRAALVMAGQIEAGTVWINEHLIVF
jgi:acyl-CoA reductase-like NAD-dependent aldehyde dehydrogenase